MPTLSILLNQLFDRITQAIQQAQNAGLILEVNAGAQAQNLINSIRLALKDELDYASNTLSAQQQQVISELQGLIDNLQNHVIDDLTAKTQTIANTIAGMLPGSSIPQVSIFTGNIIAPNANATVNFALSGNFVDVARSGFDATLNFDNGDANFKSIVNTSKTTQQITFQIDSSLFTSSEEKVTYFPISVDIPFRKTELLVLHTKKYFTYKFILIVLPKAIGTITLESTKLEDVRHEVGGICSNLIWDSSQDDIDKVDGCNIEEGWQCIRETVSYSFSRQEGDINNDWFDLGNVSTPTYVGWHFKTLHKGFGTSGKLTVNLSYRKWKNIPEPNVSKDIIQANWGDVKVVSVDPSSHWKIIYKQFDGEVKEFASSDQSNPYVKLSSTGNQITIRAVPQ